MSDAVPDALTAVPPPRDRRIVVTAAISVALHLMLLIWLALPRLSLPEPAEPPAVNVDLVPPSELSSVEPPSSSLAPSSLPSSAEAPSSEAASAVEASSAEPSSAEPESSAEPPASAEPASSASAEASASAAQASSAPTPSAASSEAASEASSSVAPPTPMARPIVIPVGPSAESSEETSSIADASASEEPSSAASELASAEPSSAASEPEGASALTTTASGADAVAEPSSVASAQPIPPSLTGALHAAKRYYLEAMLNAPAMEKAREAIKKLPPEKRLAQTCNIEAVGQAGNAGKGYEPDALVANAFAKPVIAGNTFTVTGGAFRSKQKWFGIAYTCTLSEDMSAVKSFSFRVGADVTAELKARVGD